MKIFLPAIGPLNNVKVFEIQTLAIKNGNFQVIVTGNALSNIEEEISVVFSLLRYYEDCFGIDDNLLKEMDYHVHFSDMSLVKEGESSGVSIFISVICALKGWHSKYACLATGEIDLRGTILPIYEIEKKLQVDQETYNYIIIPESCLNEELRKNKKVIGMKDIFDLFQFIKRVENEMVNL